MFIEEGDPDFTYFMIICYIEREKGRFLWFIVSDHYVDILKKN